MLTSDGNFMAKNALKLFSKYLKERISEVYIDDNKLKHSSNPTDILKSPKNFYEKLYTKETTSKAPATEFSSQIPSKKKIS